MTSCSDCQKIAAPVDLASRIQQEVARAKAQVVQLHEDSAERTRTLAARYEEFERARTQLRDKFEPRIKLLMEQIKDVRVDHDRDRDGGQVRLHMGHTEMVPPAVTLRFVLSHAGEMDKLALDYYLSIIPTLFDFKGHDRIEVPLADLAKGPGTATLLAWVDDRIVEFSQAYLKIPFIDAYHQKNRVTDPVAKVAFNKLLAKGTIDHKGTTYYFASDESLEAFKREPDTYVKG